MLQPAPQPAPQTALELQAEALAPGPDSRSEPSPDPEDWSDDLARIDLEVQRLGWDRNQEAIYLQRAFGHPSRSRLTRYGDLVAYLQVLAQLSPAADPALVPLPLRRRDLLEQCDELLRRLGWDPDPYSEVDVALTRHWLRSKGNSIEGGSSEVQRNIIAQQVLGLPKDK